MSCRHDGGIRADVVLHRMVKDDDPQIRAMAIELVVVCALCDVPFEFLGLPMGVNFSHPTTGIDRLKLFAPVTPQGVEPLRDHGLVEYAIREKAREE